MISRRIQLLYYLEYRVNGVNQARREVAERIMDII